MAFSGRATHDTGTFSTSQEDVSPIVSRISPFEAPLLDALGDAKHPAYNATHEWIEDRKASDGGAARTRRNNPCQIIKKGILIFGTMVSVSQHGVDNEYRYQVLARTREALRDLEKCAVIGKRGKRGPRRMAGIIEQIQTQRITVAAFGRDAVDDVLDRCGAIDVIVCGADCKKALGVDVWTGAHGVQRVLLCRWMPPNAALFLASALVKVLPLEGRSFFARRTEPEANAVHGDVIGEYTTEVRYEEEMAYVALAGA